MPGGTVVRVADGALLLGCTVAGVLLVVGVRVDAWLARRRQLPGQRRDMVRRILDRAAR